jgi:hypothetical protein
MYPSTIIHSADASILHTDDMLTVLSPEASLFNLGGTAYFLAAAPTLVDVNCIGIG